jgi:hypothetical protein
MLNKKLLLSVIAIAVMCLTLGFFTLSGDDPTSSVSFSTFRSAEQIPKITGDYLLGIWTVGTAVPTPGSYGGAGVGFSRNDTCWLYAVNGDTDGASGSAGHFRKYNITTNTWTILPPNTGRSWISATKLGPVSNTFIYTLGGLPTGASWTSLTGTLQRYSINSNTWTTLLDAPVPVGSSGFCSYQDSLLYSVGGMGTAGSAISNVQLYNVNSNTWRTATPLPTARANGWMVIRNDTIYYGCGAFNTTTFYNDIYVGKISSTDRATITWTTSAITYPGVSRHRMDASDFMGRFFIGPGTGAIWWNAGNEAYTWNGGNSPFVSVGPVPVATSDAQVGTASFQRGNYKVWKAIVASGLVLSVPYYITNTQIYTDSVLTTGIHNIQTEIPEDFQLYQNYPNPFNPVTKINYALPTSGLVTLKIYDVLGREVMTLVNEMKSAGNYTVDFNGANLSSGIYFYTLKSDDFTAVKKMTLIK